MQVRLSLCSVVLIVRHDACPSCESSSSHKSAARTRHNRTRRSRVHANSEWHGLRVWLRGELEWKRPGYNIRF